jgi:beta-lactamase superfamily II metal-dependent hydrolase
MHRSALFGTRNALRSPWPILVALALVLVPAAALAQADGKLQIHHIDVGQGDGMLLISPNGQTALFDDGVYTNCTNIKAYLQALGITTVDYHFASHYHADHIGCIDDLAAIGITIGTAGYDRGYSYSSGTYTNYVSTLGALRTTIQKGQIVTLDAGSPNPVTITCIDLNGAGVYPVNGSDENSKSVCLKVTYGAFDEEIDGDLTGDVGNDVETTVGPEVGDIEVYKVHHHGSKYSTNENWLNATTPEVAIIQCGDGNTYGHPTAEALGRLHAHGVYTYWNETGEGAIPDPQWDTVANGTIVVEADPGENDTYTVSGPGFSDTYQNGGGGSTPPTTLTETVVASSVTPLVGSVTGGSAADLAANDGSYLTISAAKVHRLVRLGHAEPSTHPDHGGLRRLVLHQPHAEALSLGLDGRRLDAGGPEQRRHQRRHHHVQHDLTVEFRLGRLRGADPGRGKLQQVELRLQCRLHGGHL